MRGKSSGCCRKFGNMNLNAALFGHTMCQCCSIGFIFVASVVTFAVVSMPDVGNAAVVEFNCTVAFVFCDDDDDIKPGGGSTPSAISSARCKRAFLSQSSIGNSSGLNLFDTNI